nr:transglutaminase-like cysteine peptidase [Marinicella sp. W31]MDC2879490.1 transglutaminase-like cysteine peptidase [Marinicella sp. W31]
MPRFNQLAYLVFCAMASVSGAGLFGATAAAAGMPAMPIGGVTSQPIGHFEFCQEHRRDCTAHSGNTDPARLTSFGWQAVQRVNLAVNAEIEPVTDHDLYGREEVWAYPDSGAGDCEDFVLEKRRRLMDAGFPAANLLITVVRKPNGEGHAVLTLRSTKGDFILDNLSDEIMLWSDTPYTFLKRQASFDSGRWAKVETGTDLPVASLR